MCFVVFCGAQKGKSAGRYEGFEITHFADLVAYDISKFLVKNMEVCWCTLAEGMGVFLW